MRPSGVKSSAVGAVTSATFFWSNPFGNATADLAWKKHPKTTAHKIKTTPADTRLDIQNPLHVINTRSTK
jgi:hypothetical protein